MPKHVRSRLDILYGTSAAAPFALYCLKLLRRQLDLHRYFESAEEAYGPFVELGLDILECTRAGFVYLAVNPTMRAGIHKIGLTRKAPRERMRTLRTSGTLGAFHLIKSWRAIDVAVAEANCKRALAPRHVAGEFFFGTYSEIAATMDAELEKETQTLADLRAMLQI